MTYDTVQHKILDTPKILNKNLIYNLNYYVIFLSDNIKYYGKNFGKNLIVFLKTHQLNFFKIICINVEFMQICSTNIQKMVFIVGMYRFK